MTEQEYTSVSFPVNESPTTAEMEFLKELATRVGVLSNGLDKVQQKKEVIGLRIDEVMQENTDLNSLTEELEHLLDVKYAQPLTFEVRHDQLTGVICGLIEQKEPQAPEDIEDLIRTVIEGAGFNYMGLDRAQVRGIEQAIRDQRYDLRMITKTEKVIPPNGNFPQ